MIRKITLLFLACLGMQFASMAQPVCGADGQIQQKMAQNPGYAAALSKNDAQWATFMALQNNALLITLPNGKYAYEIPVVVHVMYTTEKTWYNVSSTQIQGMIDYLNQTFQALYSSYPDTNNGGTRIPLVFKLAKRSPTCAPTTGINYVNMSSNTAYYNNGVNRSNSNGLDDDILKAFSIWPNDRYYNVWIVNKIDGNDGTVGGPYVAGYAYYPPAPSDVDGCLMLANNAVAGEITLPHEVGHSFNLRHVFDGGTTTVCPPNANCATDNDRVCDTEPIRQSNFNCPSGTNPCTGVPYNFTQYNFMDYSNCQDRFTPGQRTRMMNALFQYRVGLITSLGATDFPVSPLPTACAVTMPSAPSGNSPFGPREISIETAGGTPVFEHESSGYTGDGNQFYLNNVCAARAELMIGQTYDMSVNVGFGTFPNINSRLRVYIDYNNNGTLNDAGELIVSRTSVSGNQTFSFTVPTTAVGCVPVRMRVMADNEAAGSLTGPCAALNFGQAEDYEVVLRGSGSGNIPSGLVDIIQPPMGGNPSCLNSSVTVATTHVNTITPIWYQWYRKSATPPNTITVVKSSVDSFVTSSTWGDLDTVWARVAYPGLCGVDTTHSDTIVLYRPLTVAPAVTIGLTKGTNPGCPDDTIRASVINNVNPGANPTYTWTVNGVPQTVTTPFIDLWNLPNNTTISVSMLSSGSAPCAGNPVVPVTSNTITYTHTTKAPTLNIALIGGTNPGCPNQALTFLATGTTGGNNPTFDWKVNGITQQIGSSNTFTGVFNDNDVISATMISSTSCAVPNTATSTNTITVTHQPLIADVTIQLVTMPPYCTGHELVFTATPSSAGSNPQYQWLINNTPVANANGQLFSTSALLNGDVVACVLISTDPCVANTLDTSNKIPMVMTISKQPTITVSISQGNNPGCLDSLVEFTPTVTNLGTGVNFDWFVNNFLTFNGPVFSTTNLLNGDVVVCRANQTDGGCYLPDTIFSQGINMVRSPTPDPPIISLVGNRLVTNKTGNFIWFGPDGQYSGGTNGSFHPTVLGKYWAVTNNNGCWSKPSNYLTITLLDINSIDLNEVNIYPNPTTGKLVADWGGQKVNMQIAVYSTIGQKLMEDRLLNASRKELDLGNLANGIYFVVFTNDEGKTGTVRVTVSK